MPASKAQQKAVNKYVKANYDLYQIKMPKGLKDIIKAHAETHNESVNGFINRAISETMERDTAQQAVEVPTTHTEGGVVSLPSREGKRAPAASEGRVSGIDPASADRIEGE